MKSIIYKQKLVGQLLETIGLLLFRHLVTLLTSSPHPTPKITIATINRHDAAAIHAQGLDTLRGAY